MSQELEPTPPDTDVLLVLPAGEVSGHSIPFCFFPRPCLRAMTQAAEKICKEAITKVHIQITKEYNKYITRNFILKI